jgi:ABC-type Zn uptake system ZnuABC Zn-binding protein ZnuA
MKSQGAHVILVQPYQNRKTAETVARQTGATVLDMPEQPGARPNTATYIDMMNNLVATLAAGLKGAK